MSKSVKIKKGLNIRLKGAAGKILAGAIPSALFAIKPSDFPSITPRLNVKPGDQVKAGTTIFHDKSRPELKFASPVSGTVRAVNRGEKRILLEVVIERSGDDYIQFGKSDPGAMSRQQIKEKILEAGLWPVIRQRPYHIIANPSSAPKSIFISAFDSSPLAPDLNFVSDNTDTHDFQTGLDVLKKLTDGKVNLVLDGSSEPSSLLKNTSGVDIHWFTGPHPAGNVGIHIHHLDPVNKGESVWYVNLQDVAVIGTLFNHGICKPDRIIALAGSEVINPQYYRTRSGASVRELISGNISEGKVRIISGNVLTGTSAGLDGYLGFYDNMITVIPEGDYFEFFGWAMPGLKKYSFSRTFLSSLAGKKDYRLDTNIHGGHRAFVLTGQYEKVVPMDIYPMQLLKAILAEDIDNMENLGIYEIAEEDFALCEFICPSKTEIQSIVRKGLDLMVKEMN
jgi:Na+-transporting NADH:ubiquinone oxidoreductase subunit A